MHFYISNLQQLRHLKGREIEEIIDALLFPRFEFVDALTNVLADVVLFDSQILQVSFGDVQKTRTAYFVLKNAMNDFVEDFFTDFHRRVRRHVLNPFADAENTQKLLLKNSRNF